MKMIIQTFILLLVAVTFTFAQGFKVKASGEQTFNFEDKRNQLKFFSTTPLEDITGISNAVKGKVILNVSDIKTMKGSISIPVSSLKTAIDLRDEEYLARRESLAAVVFLQDSRRLPAAEELFLWEFLRERGRRVIPVMTKADKLKRGERSRQLKLFTAALAPLGVDPGGVIWYSALTREGRDQLWDQLLACLGET